MKKEELIPEYISDEIFRKMTKNDRMKMGMFVPSMSNDTEVEQLILIPTNKKNSGYHVGEFFARNKYGWFRLMTYDCWRIFMSFEKQPNFKYQVLQGDFEYGGVNIFSIGDEHMRAFIRYGGEILIEKK